MTMSAYASDTRGREVLPPEAYAVALLSLPGLWPARLAALLGQRRQPRPGRAAALFDERDADPGRCQRDPAAAWALVRAGRAADVPALGRLLSGSDAEVMAAHWAAAAARIDVGRRWDEHRRASVAVDLLGSATYPPELAGDPAAPYVVFRTGSHRSLCGSRVAIIGTRRCSPAGREIATEFGEALSAAGARVVSGLALGIDAAAHQGALAAGGAAPIGVVAGGFDLPYPARHRTLWRQVADAGVLISEWPLGTRSEGWRFPARNRIIAAVADVVVVVESRESGGSMITAGEASDRGIPVLAVPGSIRNPAAAGTNSLIRDGAQPVCGVAEVLSMIGLQPGPAMPNDRRPVPSPPAAAVLAAVGWEPTPSGVLAGRTGLDLVSLTTHLAHLELDGWVAGGGGWWQRLAAERPP